MGTYWLNFFSQAASKLNKGIFNRFFKICRLIFGHIPFSEFYAQWLESCASKSCYMVMGGHWTVRSSFDQFFFETGRLCYFEQSDAEELIWYASKSRLGTPESAILGKKVELFSSTPKDSFPFISF